MSLFKICSRLSRLEDFVLLLASVATSYCCCNDLLPFSMITLLQQNFLCRDSILCISSNNYVTTSIIMSQHSFSAASASWCRDPSFHVEATSLFRLCCKIILYYLHFCPDLFSCRDNISVLSCCNNVSHVVIISIATQKFSRDIVLLP